MIKSMTGFGRAQQVIGGRDITVEIKTVNHRYYEFAARTPRGYGFLEERLKSHVQGHIARGKVDVGVIIQTLSGGGTSVSISEALAENYVNALREFGAKAGLEDDLTLSALSRFNDIFTVQKESDDEDEIWAAVQAVADEALAKCVAMRENEGARLGGDLAARLAAIAGHVDEIERLAPARVHEYRERLEAKVRELLDGRGVEEQRILTEVAIFADKVAVDEETTRLRSHLAQFGDILPQREAVGRKLDFLVQEINREANTIGSKIQDAGVARVVVEIKSEVEKIREQIQNIE